MADGDTGRRGRLRGVRSFLAGGVLGGVVVAATRRRGRAGARVAGGLAAFDGAPCASAGPDGEPREPAAGGPRA